jgi:DNA-binding YbaB/EbfC family protein
MTDFDDDTAASPLGGLDGLLSQAMEMQQQMMAAQAEAAEQVVEGQAGGGVVRITVTGAGQFTGVEISPQAVDADDVEMLQDLVLAALHDAMARVHELQARSMGGIGDLLGGGGLGDMAEMLGLGGSDVALDAESWEGDEPGELDEADESDDDANGGQSGGGQARP